MYRLTVKAVHKDGTVNYVKRLYPGLELSSESRHAGHFGKSIFPRIEDIKHKYPHLTFYIERS